MRGALLGATAAVALAAALIAPASATVTENYPGFSDTSGLHLVPSATTALTSDGTVLQLTNGQNQAGAAYSSAAVTLGSGSTFSTTFRFRIANPGGVASADGFTFILAQTPTGLGTFGSGLGYGGVANSVAIEFDTYPNGLDDGNSSNHVAIDVDGNVANTSGLSDLALANVYGISSCDYKTGAEGPGCMSNGDLWTASIGYNGRSLSVALTDPSEPDSFAAITDYPIDIGSYLGTNAAYVGFTAATAGGWEDHDIVSWQFANDTSLAPVPEPGSMALLGAGLVGLGLVLRRRRRGDAPSRA